MKFLVVIKTNDHQTLRQKVNADDVPNSVLRHRILIYHPALTNGQAHFLCDTLEACVPMRTRFAKNAITLLNCSPFHATDDNGTKVYFENDRTLLMIELWLFVDFNAHSIDYSWASRVLALVRKEMEVWESLNWMSTLGGAYSCLGEHDTMFAKLAGNMSKSQLVLSGNVGDPNLVARCAMYKVYSLCQLGRKRAARQLMKQQIYPFLLQMIINKCCDNVVKNMYQAACHRIKYYNYKSLVSNKG